MAVEGTLAAAGPRGARDALRGSTALGFALLVAAVTLTLQLQRGKSPLSPS